MATTQQLVHPKDALFGGEKPFPLIIPSCEHFAGSEKLILKALQGMQDTVGPVFDITCDCEDGAAKRDKKVSMQK